MYTICFKGLISKKRAAYWTIKFIGENKKYGFYKEDCDKYMNWIENEIANSCEDVIHYLQNFSLKKVTAVENWVYVLKTIGDMFWYIAECSTKDWHF